MIVVPLSTIVLLQGKLFKSSESCFVSPVWPDLANIYYIFIIYYILYRYCQCEVCLVISHLTSAQHYSPPTTKAWHSWLPDTIIISNINHFVRVLQIRKVDALSLAFSLSKWLSICKWCLTCEVGGGRTWSEHNNFPLPLSGGDGGDGDTKFVLLLQSPTKTLTGSYYLWNERD